jgi:hypothetical protein
MIFNSVGDIKKFTASLIKCMDDIGEISLKKELTDWDNNSFTTSSEFLGELRMILRKIKYVEKLDSKIKNDITRCIASIDEAFR